MFHVDLGVPLTDSSGQGCGLETVGAGGAQVLFRAVLATLVCLVSSGVGYGSFACSSNVSASQVCQRPLFNHCATRKNHHPSHNRPHFTPTSPCSSTPSSSPAPSSPPRSSWASSWRPLASWTPTSPGRPPRCPPLCGQAPSRLWGRRRTA